MQQRQVCEVAYPKLFLKLLYGLTGTSNRSCTRLHSVSETITRLVTSAVEEVLAGSTERARCLRWVGTRECAGGALWLILAGAVVSINAGQKSFLCGGGSGCRDGIWATRTANVSRSRLHSEATEAVAIIVAGAIEEIPLR